MLAKYCSQEHIEGAALCPALGVLPCCETWNNSFLGCTMASHLHQEICLPVWGEALCTAGVSAGYTPEVPFLLLLICLDSISLQFHAQTCMCS